MIARFYHNFFLIAFIVIIANLGFYVNVYDGMNSVKQKVITSWQSVQQCYTKSLSYSIKDYLDRALTSNLDNVDIVETNINDMFIEPSILLNIKHAYFTNYTHYITDETNVKGSPISTRELIEKFKLIPQDEEFLHQKMLFKIDFFGTLRTIDKDIVCICVSHIKSNKHTWTVLIVVPESEILLNFGVYDKTLFDILIAIFVTVLSGICLFNIYFRLKNSV